VQATIYTRCPEVNSAFARHLLFNILSHVDVVAGTLGTAPIASIPLAGCARCIICARDLTILAFVLGCAVGLRIWSVHMLFISELHKFPEVYGSPCSTGFWFPKSLESWLRLFLVYCNTKDNPLQTSAFPI
jgi:hypothetical protein